uniref:uncharacterized protein n=1 Tax=Myxine glutinosa TaxID=7769 RepID=UPI00358E6C8F
MVFFLDFASSDHVESNSSAKLAPLSVLQKSRVTKISMDCVFSRVDACSHPNQPLSVCTERRISSIIDASKLRGDGLHVDIANNFDDSNFTMHYHKNCVSSYTSKSHLNRLRKSESRSVSPLPHRKRQCRSDLRSFEFRRDCIFCGTPCEQDKKNPNRQKRRVVFCRTADRIHHKPFKTAILDNCHTRADQWANEVLVRIEGAVSDLHAADAMYHYDCKTKFMAPKSVQLAATRATEVHGPLIVDAAYGKLVSDVGADRSRIRNSTEIYKLYQSFGGTVMSKRTLLSAVSTHFTDDLLVFTATGIASILVFRDKAKDVFNMVPDDDLEQAIRKVVKHVKSDTKTIPHHK